MKKYLLIVITLIFFINNNLLLAQDSTKSKKAGISALIQDPHVDILIPYWISKQIVIAPTFYIKYVEESGSQYGFGLVLRNYSKIGHTVSPYLGARFLVAIVNQTGIDVITDYVAGVFVGGEYFFHEQFSIGLEGQLNATFSDEQSVQFGNPGKMTLNTATALVANIYF